MIRRNFLKGFSLLGAGSTLAPLLSFKQRESHLKDTRTDREYWVSMVTRVTEPVLSALQQDRLKELMPVECVEGELSSRKEVTYLEALGRSLAGLAPWLELGADQTKEGQLRQKFITLSTQAIQHAVTPTAKSYMNFTQLRQPLVDAAFLAHCCVHPDNSGEIWMRQHSSILSQRFVQHVL